MNSKPSRPRGFGRPVRASKAALTAFIEFSAAGAALIASPHHMKRAKWSARHSIVAIYLHLIAKSCTLTAYEPDRPKNPGTAADGRLHLPRGIGRPGEFVPLPVLAPNRTTAGAGNHPGHCCLCLFFFSVAVVVLL